MTYNEIVIKEREEKKMEELSLENVKAEREVMDEYDREIYDFKTFKDCQSSLSSLRSQMSSVYECNLSNYGEALADGKDALEGEYKALEKAYDKLHDRLYPIMRETYKGYKAHSEWCRIGYTHIEEFEEADEDDLFASILGM